MNPELLAYLLSQCSADIHLHCGPSISSPWLGRAPMGEASREGRSDELHHHRCPDPCPEVDYSNPNQPYFWDHTEMN